MLILRFPKDYVDQPIVCRLAKQYDLTFNILRAQVFPRREGMMVMELSGTKKNFLDGIKYLKSMNVKVQSAGQEIKRDEARCIHCGACTAVCPTGALSVKRPEMTVEFDQQKCSVCQLCVSACITRAMKVRPTNTVFFE
jgi:ferredoxin